MISQLIPNVLRAQLADESSGLNPRLVTLAPSYGVDPYAIDFSDTSVNFNFGEIDPDQVEESSVFTYPLMTIDIGSAVDLGMIFAATFSGPVVGIIDVHHSWADESIIADFASLVSLTEEAAIKCIKDPAHQNWGGGTYNLLLRKGGISSTRTPPKFGGQGWRQRLRIVCVFELAI